MIDIKQASLQADIEHARALFSEYEAWLGMSLCFQDFETEVAGLPGRYAEPRGRLLLGRIDSEVAGCIALRDLGGGICEMKRLFVRDRFRAHGVGRCLVQRVIDDARSIGYSKMRLDTYPPKMARAVEIYRQYGFREIPAYYANPYDDVLYMEADL
jgi:putative acetyltransferase